MPREQISLRELLESEVYLRSSSKLGVALGKTIHGEPYVTDLATMPHLLIAGSTGTGKSTSVALILHRISQLSPEGHIVMIDPHGEYSAAFKDCGELFNVDNLQLPYWLMNFEEHCEVLLTTHGSERQRDADILAKCLLAARTKGKNLEQFGKVTVDSPIPYLLTDLNAILVNEMGKLERAGDTLPYQRLKTKLEELRNDPRYTFMFSGMLVSDTMGSFVAKLFRLPAHGKPISIVDVSGVPSEITSVVVSTTSVTVSVVVSTISTTASVVVSTTSVTLSVTPVVSTTSVTVSTTSPTVSVAASMTSVAPHFFAISSRCGWPSIEITFDALTAVVGGLVILLALRVAPTLTLSAHRLALRISIVAAVLIIAAQIAEVWADFSRMSTIKDAVADVAELISASFVGLVLHLINRAEKEEISSLRRAADVDHLTGLVSRSFFHRAAERLGERMRRNAPAGACAG